MLPVTESEDLDWTAQQKAPIVHCQDHLYQVDNNFALEMTLRCIGRLLLHVMHQRLSRLGKLRSKRDFAHWHKYFRLKMSFRHRKSQMEAWRLARVRVRVLLAWRVRVWRRRDVRKIVLYGQRRVARCLCLFTSAFARAFFLVLMLCAHVLLHLFDSQTLRSIEAQNVGNCFTTAKRCRIKPNACFDLT